MLQERMSAPLARLLLATLAAMSLLVAACDDNNNGANRGSSPPESQPQRQAQSDPPAPPSPPRAQPGTPAPPSVTPGAAPSASRLTGTWVVSEAKLADPKAAATGDKAEGTTYRFEEGGKVTVAGSKACAYTLNDAMLKIDCRGAAMAGKLEFSDAQTMVWTIADKESLTFKKR